MPAEYEFYICDESGKPVSDRQNIIADKTGDDRAFRLRFMLKGTWFDKSAVYYLVIKEKESGETDKTEFNIDVAFTDDFGF